MEIRGFIIKTLANLLEDRDVRGMLEQSNDLNQLGLNSMSYIKLVIELEEEYGVDFDDDLLIFSENMTLDELCGQVEIVIREQIE